MSSTFKTKESKQAERRYFPRWKVDKDAIYQLSHNPVEKEARILDMSCAGACVLSPEPLLPAQRVVLSIFLSKVKIISVNGRVAWIRHSPQQNEAGVAFDDIDAKTQNVILGDAFNQKKQDLVQYWFKGWDGHP